MSGTEPPKSLQEWLAQLLFERFGVRGVVAFLIVSALAVGYWKRTELLAESCLRVPLPSALCLERVPAPPQDVSAYTVELALLDKDRDETVRELLESTLEGYGFEVLRYPRTLSSHQDAVARLRQTKARLMVWGRVLRGVEGPSRAQLRRSLPIESTEATSGVFEVAWQHGGEQQHTVMKYLGSVVALVVALPLRELTRATEGKVSEPLAAALEQASATIESTDFERLPAAERGRLRTPVADAMRVVAAQRSDTQLMKKAYEHLLAAVDELEGQRDEQRRARLALGRVIALRGRLSEDPGVALQEAKKQLQLALSDDFLVGDDPALWFSLQSLLIRVEVGLARQQDMDRQSHLDAATQALTRLTAELARREDVAPTTRCRVNLSVGFAYLELVDSSVDPLRQLVSDETLRGALAKKALAAYGARRDSVDREEQPLLWAEGEFGLLLSRLQQLKLGTPTTGDVRVLIERAHKLLQAVDSRTPVLVGRIWGLKASLLRMLGRDLDDGRKREERQVAQARSVEAFRHAIERLQHRAPQRAWHLRLELAAALTEAGETEEARNMLQEAEQNGVGLTPQLRTMSEWRRGNALLASTLTDWTGEAAKAARCEAASAFLSAWSRAQRLGHPGLSDRARQGLLLACKRSFLGSGLREDGQTWACALVPQCALDHEQLSAFGSAQQHRTHPSRDAL